MSADSRSAPDSTSPLLERVSSQDRSGGALWTARGRTLEAARYIQRAGSSRFLREPSLRIREAATEELEERQIDWAYSGPVVLLDLLWNIAFVAVAVLVLILSYKEDPSAPLRAWIIGYCIQCSIHMVCVWTEYKKRRESPDFSEPQPESQRMSTGGGQIFQQEISDEEDSISTDSEEQNDPLPNFTKKIESFNTAFSFLWWILGFYFLFYDLDGVFRDAPMLSWLCTVFLAFDVFFVVFCLALACVIGIAVCCCLPCIIALLYALKEKEGASDEDLKKLPVFVFRKTPIPSPKVFLDEEKSEETSGGVMILKESSKSDLEEQKLAPDASVCCICLNQYEDGSELRQLTCHHHFHLNCIDKWLKVKPLCPLCKRNAFTGEDPEADNSEAINSVANV